MNAGTPDPDSNHAVTERAAQIIAQALMEAEVIIAADRDARAGAMPAQTMETLERFGDILTRLVEYTESLAGRMADLTEAVATLVDSRATARGGGGRRPQLPQMEPSFAPGGEGIDVAIAAVPGFEALMEVQRALVRLPQVQSAAVRSYQDDEVGIQLVLSQPMTPTAIAEGISAGTGAQIVVDEARPDALRLRLRFL